MATKYYTKYKASFKTAYLQREIPMVAKTRVTSETISGTLTDPSNNPFTLPTDLHVGDVVKLNGGYVELALENNSTSAATNTGANAIIAGNYIVAQSDMTLGYGHVPVEYQNYKYEDKVEPSADDKPLALFKIINPDDLIIVRTDFTETTA